MATSVHPDYVDAHDQKYGDPVPVPLIIATEDNIKQYGRFVNDFDAEEVWITPWPVKGPRPLHPGTGQEGGLAHGNFKCRWEGDQLVGVNEAVGRDFVTGRLPKGMPPDKRTHVLVRELNYHPDGGQVFYPSNGGPFVALLALPGDDIKLKDFKAFYFDGSAGLQIYADVWHQSMYPVREESTYKGKQGAVYACVFVDTVKEFGKWLSVPLKRELAQQ